jgi:tetratricopeptide (TPR) repeat protein
MHRSVILFFFFIISIASFSQAPKWQEWETEADTLLRHEDFEGAIKLYNKVIEASQLKDRADYRALYKRGVAYYSMGDFQNAIKDMDRFIPEFQESYQARVLRALCYREAGETDKQLEDVEKALELSGGDVQLLRWRASILVELEKFEVALPDLKLIRQVQDDAEVEMNLGIAYYSTGYPDSAFISINKAIELEATFFPAYMYGASFALQDSNYDLALKYLNIALMLDSENTTALFYKGVALMELDQEDKACSCLQKAFYLGYDDAADYLKQYCFGVED